VYNITNIHTKACIISWTLLLWQMFILLALSLSTAVFNIQSTLKQQFIKLTVVRPFAYIIKAPVFTRWFCSSVSLSVANKTAIFSKSKQFGDMVCIDNLGKPTWAFQRTHYWIPKIQNDRDTPSWKSWNRHIATKNHPILMKFGTQQYIWNSMTVTTAHLELDDSQITKYEHF